MTKERLKEWVEWVVLCPVRIRHRLKAQHKHRVRADAIATTRRTLASARGLSAASTQTVFNVGLYVLLIDQDLAEFTDDFVSAIGDRRRQFVAKHEAMLLYEAAEDLPQLLGRRFRDAAKVLGADESQLNRLNAASAGLHRFWEQHRDFLGAIRKALAAHREHDALLYLTKLEAVEPLDVMRRAAEFSGLLERLIAVVTEIASLTSGIPSILRDMKALSSHRD